MAETIKVTCPICGQSVAAVPSEKGQAKIKPHYRPGVWTGAYACNGGKCSVMVPR